MIFSILSVLSKRFDVHAVYFYLHCCSIESIDRKNFSSSRRKAKKAKNMHTTVDSFVAYVCLCTCLQVHSKCVCVRSMRYGRLTQL